MSGRKRSRVSMDGEWARRWQRDRLAENLSQIRNDVNSLVQKMTVAGHEQHGEAIRVGREWLTTQARAASQKADESVLRSLIDQGAALAKRAGLEIERVQQQVLLRARGRITDCESQLVRSASGLEKYQLRTAMTAIKQLLSTAQGAIVAGRLGEADRLSLTAESELSAVLNELSAKMRAEHVSALRQRLFAASTSSESKVATANAILESSTAGARQMFPIEVAGVEQWLLAVKNEQAEWARKSENDDVVEQYAERFENLSRDGTELIASLKAVMLEKLSEMRGTALANLHSMSGELDQNQDNLFQWNMAAPAEGIRQRIKVLNELLLRDQFADLDSGLEEARTELHTLIKNLHSNEEKYQTRMHVLQALRQVCVDMGFGEVAPPRAEHDGDKSSPIRLIVDTFDRGKIRFALTLDQIESDSEVSEQHCFEEFDTLSQRLRDSFGVETRFECEGSQRPLRIRKNESQDPYDGGAAMTGSEGQ